MAISYISQASAASSSVAAMPTHATGDYIILWAMRNNIGLPSLPSGYTQIFGGGSSTFGYVAYKIAASSSESNPTATNANGVVIQVYRGVTGIGVYAGDEGSSNSISYPALTLTTLNGSSWSLRFSGHTAATNMATNAPTTAPSTIRTATTTRIVGIDSNGGLTANISTGTQSVSPSGGWISLTLELLGDPSVNPGQFFAML